MATYQDLRRLATASAPGAMPAALFTKLTNETVLNSEACPAFSAGAATWTPGTNKAAECAIEATRTIGQLSTLTVSATNAIQGFYLVTCRALALGYILTIANGGPGGGNLATVPASMTVPRAIVLYFDGTNFSFDGYCWVQ